MTFTGFRPAAFRFLRQLKRNNRREWFQAHRDVYEHELREPVGELLQELDVRLATLAPELVADPKRAVFRIHRDVRFSKDKSPYKTNVAFWVNHRDLGRSAATVVHGGAGLYFHVEPGESIIAGGIWMPPAPALLRIRDALIDDREGFERSLRTLKRRFGGLSTEAVLQRLPRGYPENHPAGRWLRYKSFTVSRPVSVADLRRADLPERLARDYRVLIPFVRWLNSALGFPPATRR
jgi:uncharacterized protein (TIGR02453 family)